MTGQITCNDNLFITYEYCDKWEQWRYRGRAPIHAWMPALNKPRAASVDRGSWALFILLARTECPRDLSKSQDGDLVQGLQQLPALARPSGDEMCPPWAEPVSHRHGHPAPSCSTREAQNGMSPYGF